MIFRKTAAALAAMMALVAPAIAHATTKVRVEWVRTASMPTEPSLLFGAQTLTATGAVSQVQTTAAPSFGINGVTASSGVAHVTVISGAAILAWGSNPTATEATGLRLQQGEERWIPIGMGQTVAIVEAADPTSISPVTDGANLAYAAPTQLTVGGAAIPAGRSVDAECTAAGTATLNLLSGGTIVWNVVVGSQDKPWSVTGVASVAGGAACTFYSLQ